jgi:hypothetical protein
LSSDGLQRFGIDDLASSLPDPRKVHHERLQTGNASGVSQTAIVSYVLRP